MKLMTLVALSEDELEDLLKWVAGWDGALQEKFAAAQKRIENFRNDKDTEVDVPWSA
jgi:hypothetical protein